MNVLVGDTGFVGSNLYATGQFGMAFHSTNISMAYGTKPELLVYAGLRAEKFLANQQPGQDRELIVQAEENIARISPKKLALISTVDVFPVPKDVDENSEVDTENLHPYGLHRRQLELWAREAYPDALIIRLPGLFGKNIKKNFIYDYIHVIPSLLKKAKMEELAKLDGSLADFYQLQENGYYKVKELKPIDREILKGKFRKVGFEAAHFTDSRSIYQFYNLGRLWGDIQIALREGILLWHPATEPIAAHELYQYLSGREFANELGGVPADYGYQTIYGELFGGRGGFIDSKGNVMKQIKEFTERELNKG